MVNGLWEFLSFFFPPWIRENLCDELIFTAVPTEYSIETSTYFISMWQTENFTLSASLPLTFTDVCKSQQKYEFSV